MERQVTSILASSCGFGELFLQCRIIAPIVPQCNKVRAQMLSRIDCKCVIVDTGKGFLAAEHLEHIEDSG